MRRNCFSCESCEIFHQSIFTIHPRVIVSGKSNHTEVANMFLEQKTLKEMSIFVTYFCQWRLKWKVTKLLHFHKEISNDWLLLQITGYNIYSAWIVHLLANTTEEPLLFNETLMTTKAISDMKSWNKKIITVSKNNKKINKK